MSVREPLMPRTGPGRQTNFWLHVAEGALFSAGFALLGPQTLLPLLVTRFTGSSGWVGVMAAIIPLGLAAPQLLSVRWLERFPGRWRYFLWTNWVCRLAVVPLSGVPLLPAAWRLPGLVTGLAVFALAWGMAAPSWMDLVQRVIQPEDRGRFFGWRATLQGPATLVAQGLGSWLLSTGGYPYGFVACFGLACLLMTVSMVLMALTVNEGHGPVADFESSDAGETGAGSRDDDPLRTRDGMAFVAWRLLLSLALSVLPFALLDARTRFQLPDGRVMTLGLALFLLPTLTSVWWGRQGDRHGPWWLLSRATWLAVPAHACLVWAPVPAVHAVGLVGLGMLQPLLVMADFAFLGGGDGRRAAARYGKFNLVLLLATLGGPVAAGALADRAGTTSLLAIAAVLWAIAFSGIRARSLRLQAGVA
ncbi:MAG: MFS transporter [bacterium]|nr:MFS transporter [bacterium]